MGRDGMSRGRGDLFLNLFLTLELRFLQKNNVKDNVKDMFFSKKIIQNNYNKPIKTENSIYVYTMFW